VSPSGARSFQTRLPQTRLFLATLLLICGPALAKAEPEALLGDWVLNSELTHEMQPKQSAGGGGGFGAPTISVGGVGIPLPGGASNPQGGNARDPRVLRCDAMSIAMADDNVHFTYRGSGEETMRPGNDQGRKTSWRRDRLTQKYSTNTRTVQKSYELDSDGRLIVKVKISPKGAKSATHVRVFERPAD
jgi:hypothetical protein